MRWRGYVIVIKLSDTMYLPIVFRVSSLFQWQLYECPIANGVTLNDKVKVAWLFDNVIN